MAKQKSRRRYSFRKANRHYSRPKMTLPVAVIAGLAPTIAAGINGFQVGNSAGGFARGLSFAASQMSAYLTGWNYEEMRFRFDLMSKGLLPLLLGVAAHKVVGGMFGVNRLLSRAKMPLVRI